MNANKYLLGFKGHEILDAGYIYAPYIPIQTCPTITLSQMGKQKIVIETLITKFEINKVKYELHLLKEFDYSALHEPIFDLKYSSFSDEKFIDHMINSIPYFPMRPILHQSLQYLPYPVQVHEKCLEALKNIANG